MQPAAETPLSATPGQSVLSRSSPTLTPWPPAATTCWCSAGVYQLGLGRTGEDELAAAAVDAESRPRAHVRTSARRSLDRMDFLPAGVTVWGHAVGVPQPWPYPAPWSLNRCFHARRGPRADLLGLARAVLAREPRRPPDARADVEPERRDEHGAHQERVEQDAEGDDEADLGQEHERQHRQRAEGASQHDSGRGDDRAGHGEPSQHAGARAVV